MENLGIILLLGFWGVCLTLFCGTFLWMLFGVIKEGVVKPLIKKINYGKI
jgi:hypothetical protein